MRIFLTGATGQIGSAVFDALIRAGHEVMAVVRTPQKAESITHRGGIALVGDLADSSTYFDGAVSCDGIIHAAFDPKVGAELDRETTKVLLAAAGRRVDAGLESAFLYTSGTWVLGDAPEPVDEAAPLAPPDMVSWRPEVEQFVLGASRDGLRTMVVRPGTVYGGARGLIADMLKEAGNGLVRVVGKGTNHWSCVYDRDLADLYVRLIGHAGASGVYHATDEADERVEDIVDAIVGHVRMRPDVRWMPLPEARAKLGMLAEALALDQRVRSVRARELGWAPTLHSVAGNVARLLEEFRDAREAA